MSLVVSQITRRFASSAQPVVEDASLTITPGTIVALVGESGAGKSTLLRMIAGLEAPDAGEIRLGDRLLADAHTSVPPERRGIGLVFQNHALFPHLTVEANVSFGLHGRLATEKRSEVTRLLALAGLNGCEKRMPHELSGGERQRIALVRTLAPRPALVLMDEPFSSLDASLKVRMRGEVRDILKQSGVMALIVTHDVNDALDLADRIAVINSGHILQVGAPEDLYTAPATREVALFFGPCNFLPGDAFAGLSSVGLIRPAGINEIWARPGALTIVAESRARSAGGFVGEVVASRFHGDRWEVRFHADGVSSEILVYAPEFCPSGRAGVLPRSA